VRELASLPLNDARASQISARRFKMQNSKLNPYSVLRLYEVLLGEDSEFGEGTEGKQFKVQNF